MPQGLAVANGMEAAKMVCVLSSLAGLSPSKPPVGYEQRCRTRQVVVWLAYGHCGQAIGLAHLTGLPWARG